MKFNWPPLPTLIGIPLVEIKMMVRDLEEVSRYVDELFSAGDGCSLNKAEQTLKDIHLRIAYVIRRLELELKQEDPPIHYGMAHALSKFEDTVRSKVSKVEDKKICADIGRNETPKEKRGNVSNPGSASRLTINDASCIGRDADGEGNVVKIEKISSEKDGKAFVGPRFTNDPKVKALFLERQGISPASKQFSSQASSLSSCQSNSSPPAHASLDKSAPSCPSKSDEEPLQDLSKLRISLYLSRKFCPPDISRKVIEKKLKEIGIDNITCFNAQSIIFTTSYQRARELLQSRVIIEVGGIPLLVEPTYRYLCLAVMVKTKTTPSDFHRLVPESAGVLDIRSAPVGVRLKLTFVDRVYAKKFLENPLLPANYKNLFFSMEVDLHFQSKADLRYREEVYPAKYVATRVPKMKPILLPSNRQSLMEVFRSKGWDVFFVLPDRNRNLHTGTVYFHNTRSAKEFLVSTISAGGYIVKPFSSRNNDWYRVKIKK